MNYTHPFSVKKFPIITASSKFPKDGGSTNYCSSCRGNCCFFRDELIVNSYPDIDNLKEFYSPETIKLIKKNFERMFDTTSHVFKEKTFIIGNEIWTKTFKVGGKEEVRYACPLLNIEEKCSIYPVRFKTCQENPSKKATECAIKGNELIKDVKILPLSYYHDVS